MHQDDGAAEGGRRWQHIRVELPGADVVDYVGACCDGGVGDGGAEGVDADADVGVCPRSGGFGEMRRDGANGGDGAGEFVVCADDGGVGARGVAADVEDGGAGGDVGGGYCWEGLRGVEAAVGEGVGG